MPSADLVEASAVIASKDRDIALRNTFESLAKQSIQPGEIIVIDASSNSKTEKLCRTEVPHLRSRVIWFHATTAGAASQRNQGVDAATQPVIWFFDDDILFEAECVARLWAALRSDSAIGGVNAMIVNQRYQSPRMISRLMFTIMHGKSESTFAGKVIGPAINLLPEDRADLPEVASMEWLNTTCTMYRREALPDPAFDPFFTGYSLMEDVALSLRVRQRGWNLGNARNARIIHESQPAGYKSDVRSGATMELINRYYVMNKILGRNSPSDVLRLFGWEVFCIASGIVSSGGLGRLPAVIGGKLDAITAIRRSNQAG